MHSIRYLHHNITPATHLETGQVFYELSHWFTSDKHPETSGRRSVGYFESYKEAEERHNEMLVKGLLQDE